MPFVHECPGCSKRMKLKDELKGRKVKCPDCGAPNVLGKRSKPARRPAPVAAGGGGGELPPVAGGLPPVVRPGKAKPKKKEKSKPDTKDYDGLYGRSEPLGKVDEDEFEAERKQKMMAVGGFVLLMFVLGGGYLVTSGAFKGKEEFMPKDFTKVTGPEEKYTVEVPEGWEVEKQDGGGHKSPFLRVKNEKISLNIKPHLTASLVNDVVSSTNDMLAGMAPGGKLPENMEEVHVTHEVIKKAYEGAYNDYREDPIQVIQTNMGSARYSRYDGKTPIGLREYGFRGTVMIGPFAHIVDVRMPMSYRDEFEPHFQKIMKSIDR